MTGGQVHRHDYIGPYIEDLAQVVDMDIIRSSGVRIGIDPLGGAGVGLLATHHRSVTASQPPSSVTWWTRRSDS